MQKKYINNAQFFDDHATHYGDIAIHDYDYIFINFFKKNPKPHTYLLDIGGGSGKFAKLVKNNCPDIEVTVIDPSKKLLDKIDDDRIHFLQGSLPNQIYLGESFDYIHVKEVFHHITGPSVKISKELLKKSLFTIKEHIKRDGIVLIHEIFYESYLFPTLSRNMIFYLLLIQNKLKIRIPVSEFLLGLSVCFYTRSEFQGILEGCGFRIKEYHQEYWGDSWKKRAALLKNWGRMLFILEIAK